MSSQVIAFAGGVGGARLCAGLQAIVGGDLSVIVNIGDDFEHLGLNICPDLDTVLYTLAGVEDPKQGWGRRNESWNALQTLEDLGAEAWFRLGDSDIAMHIERTRLMTSGASLSEVTSRFARALGIRAHIFPVSDDPVRTIVETVEGSLTFQDYFVRRRAKPVAHRVRFDGAENAVPTKRLVPGLNDSSVDLIVIAPSNPYLSVAPMLSISGVRDALMTATAPVVAVSPIIAGHAVKGPAAKLMAELTHSVPSVVGIAAHYRGLIDALLVDRCDQHLVPQIEEMGIAVSATDILMVDDVTRRNVAEEVIRLGSAVRAKWNELRGSRAEKAVLTANMSGSVIFTDCEQS